MRCIKGYFFDLIFRRLMADNGTLIESTAVPIPATTRSMLSRSLSDEERQRLDAVSFYDIAYRSDGLAIRGFLALPPAVEPRMPAIIFNRGGSGQRGALNAVSASQVLCLYASWGYVAIASNYRGTGGSEGTEEWGAGDVDDAMHLLPLLRSFSYVDPDRIGLIGGSRGGMMALKMLTRTDDFRAAVTFGAPTAIYGLPSSAYIYKTMSKYLPREADPDEAAKERSAVEWTGDISKNTPLLVLHGTGDKRVGPEHALLFGLELQRHLVPYRLVMYENADHILAGRRKESTLEIRNWVDAYVRDRAPLPKVGPHGA